MEKHRGQEMRFVLGLLLIANATIFAKEGIWQETVFGYKLEWSSVWKKVGEKQDDLLVLARRYDASKPDRIVGELLAAQLPGSMETESSGMLKTPEINPGIAELLDSQTVTTKTGKKAICIAMGFNISMEPFESPTVFYSVYLAGKKSGCVTIKLRCSKKDFKKLKAEMMPAIMKI
jgi:hypothetical protein